MAKPFRYKKKVIAIFIKVKYLIQYFKVVVIKNRIIRDSIMLVIILDSLHNTFEIKTVLLFYSCNKNLEEIQLIVMCTETTNLAKQITDVIGNLAIMARKTGPQQ